MQESAQSVPIEVATEDRSVIPMPEPEEHEYFFDASSRNRFEFKVRHKGKTYDTAHIFEPLSDERFMKFRRAIRARGNESRVKENSMEAAVSLWDDLIVEVENIEVSGDDWKPKIPISEKIESIQFLLAVAIAEEDLGDDDPGVRRPDDDSPEVVITEAFLNGNVVRQRHELQPTTFELKKRYARIMSQRFRQEQTGGLRREPEIEVVPKDEQFAKLYDQMLIEAKGFENDEIPVRFKTTVVHEIFDGVLDEKK